MTPNVLFYLLSRPGTLLDIGANVGQSTIGLLEVPDSHLICFEPVPENFILLCDNLMRLGGLRIMERVTVHNIGLGAQPGTFPIAIPSFNGVRDLQWPSMAKDFAALADNDEGVEVTFVTRDVVCRTLDSFGITDATFIKIDVEGFELEVLQGARQTLERSRPILHVEMEERHRANSTRDVPAFLQSLGYAGFFIEPKTDELLPWEEFSIEKYQKFGGLPNSKRADINYTLNSAIFVHREDGWALQRLARIQTLLYDERNAAPVDTRAEPAMVPGQD